MTPPAQPPEVPVADAAAPDAATPETGTGPAARHLRWPAERFYWAILDASFLPSTARDGTRRLVERLGYLFESVLPGVPIEQMHAVYRHLPGAGRRYVACGVPRTLLEQEIGAEALTLTPASLPEFVEEDVDLGALNLLTGSFLPRALRRLRWRWLLHVGAIMLVCVVLVVGGIERRVQATNAQIAGVNASKAELYGQVLGPAASRAGAGAQPPALRLTAELRRLEQTRNSGPALADTGDCAWILAELLARWPEGVYAETEAISITSTSITIRAQVPTMADAQQLADAFQALPGWLLHQPQSEARRDHIAVNLRFEPRREEQRP